MLERWRDLLVPHVDGARALAAVRDIARHHRIQASPGYDDAARWLADTLRAEGFALEVESVPADGSTARLGCLMPEGWSASRASADLVAGTARERIADFEREPLSLIQRSAPAHGRFPIVYVADGTRAEDYAGRDVRGAVVLTGGAVSLVHARAVRERGAAGLLSYGRRLVPPARTREHDRDSIAYTSFWWGADESRGWGFVVSPNLGDSLAARLAGGEPLALDVQIESRRYAGTIPLVTATLPGAWPGEVLLTAHLCHPRPGANDNASGVAAAMEALRALARAAATGELPQHRRTIRALWMPEFTGTYAWLGGAPGRAERTLAALNLDMVGEDQSACASEQLLERAPHFAASFADELARQVRHVTRTAGGEAYAAALRTREVPYSGGSDHAVWLDPAVGVPCPLLIQWPDRYYHSSLDSPDRCDVRSLAHAAAFASTYAAFLATAAAPQIEWLAQRLEQEARRELRCALEAPSPGAAVRVARWRAQRALASLGRCVPAGQEREAARATLARCVAAAAEAIEGTLDAEIAPALAIPEPTAVPRPRARIPHRKLGAPLVPMRSMQEGWLALPVDEQERWRDLDREFPGGSTALDLAWFACDGVRTLDEIAACLADEGLDVDSARLEDFFERAVRLGVATWLESGER